MTLWKSDEIKWEVFQTQAVSVAALLELLMKCLEKKLDGNYTRMVYAVLNKS